MSALETIRGRPEINADAECAIRLARESARNQAYQGIGDVDGLARGIHIAQARKDIRVLERGLHDQFGLNRADGFEVAVEHGARVDEHIRSCFENPLVLWS